MKRAITLILTLTLLMSLCMFSCTAYAADEITVTDMIGRDRCAGQLPTCGLHWRRSPAYVQLYRRYEPAVRCGGY